jgi:hypothetical protein
MLDKLTSADFAACLQQRFTLYQGPWDPGAAPSGDTLDLELVSVAELGEAPAGEVLPRRRPFSLIFRAADRGHLPQRTYSLTHADLGRLDLFLVPIGADQVGMRYEAVFT